MQMTFLAGKGKFVPKIIFKGADFCGLIAGFSKDLSLAVSENWFVVSEW